MKSCLFHKLNIKNLELENNLIAAPMAGLSSLPYRLLAIENGCALAMSEMVSAEGTIRAQEKTKRYFINDDDARPFGVQLFGANPSAISEAVRMLEDEPIDLIDINMGCPVKKVCSKGAGAALMKTPELAVKIIIAARNATRRPLTVKIRSGWDEDSINCVEIAHMAEDCGADAVAVHPRTREQMFKEKSDWKLIGAVKSKIKIPVIGNGDVKNRKDAVLMLTETGCDAIMIGRAAVGNPWIFRQISRGSSDGVSLSERGRAAVRHLNHLRSLLGDKGAILTMRTMLAWYGRGIHGVRHLMGAVHKIDDVDKLQGEIEKFFLWKTVPGINGDTHVQPRQI